MLVISPKQSRECDFLSVIIYVRNILQHSCPQTARQQSLPRREIERQEDHGYAGLLYRGPTGHSRRSEEAHGGKDHECDRRGVSHRRHAYLLARISSGKCRAGWPLPIRKAKDSRSAEKDWRL